MNRNLLRIGLAVIFFIFALASLTIIGLSSVNSIPVGYILLPVFLCGIIFMINYPTIKSVEQLAEMHRQET